MDLDELIQILPPLRIEHIQALETFMNLKHLTSKEEENIVRNML